MSRPIFSEKLVVRVFDKGDRVLVFLQGRIDDDAQLEELKLNRNTVVFDFHGVGNISSLGVRSWTRFLRSLSAKHVLFRRCSPAVVKKLNLIPAFGGNADVVSFYVPYFCPHCDSERSLLVETSKLKRGIEIPVRVHCECCGEYNMKIEGNEDQHVGFLQLEAG